MSIIDYAVVIAAVSFSALGALAGFFVGFMLFSRRARDLETFENVDENHR
jgi:hypothetical protein